MVRGRWGSEVISASCSQLTCEIKLELCGTVLHQCPSDLAKISNAHPGKRSLSYSLLFLELTELSAPSYISIFAAAFKNTASALLAEVGAGEGKEAPHGQARLGQLILQWQLGAQLSGHAV